jgi:hypothetical protein
MDRRSAPVEKLSARVARDRRIERRVVINHEHPIARDRDVELERRHAKRKRALKGRQRIFGREAARAAMALQVESLGGARQEQRARERESLHSGGDFQTTRPDCST